jgi:hypothetical protein
VVAVGERRSLPEWEVRVAGSDGVFRFADGTTMGQADVDAAVDRYLAIPVEELVEQIVTRGRPSMGAEPARVVPVRLEPRLVASVDERAAAEGCNRSELIRRALRAYLT